MPDDARAVSAAPPPTGHVVLRPSLGRKVLGGALVVLGILGLILPFLQGFLFLALALFVLRDQYVWAADRWAWVAGRWPGAVSKVEAMEGRMGARLSGWGASVRRVIGRS